ncbi:MAG: hypothetical protein R6X25_03445 [Candidatus Krumholzibacteriia bacterium]
MVLVDGHAHLHDGVGLAAFLAAARRNFRRRCPRSIPPGGLRAALCLADFPGAEGFARARGETAVEAADGDYTRLAGAEESSLAFQADDGDLLWLVAGRQAVTAEKLELVAIGTGVPLPSGLSLDRTVAAARAAGALPVLPWGVGKWLGRRGAVVSAALDRFGRELPLGDNGGRPSWWRPRLLARARARGVPVIPGGDPLRIPSDRLRNGSFGLLLEGEVGGQEPSAWLKHRLAGPLPGDIVFGGPLAFGPFVARQVSLRWPAGGREDGTHAAG